MNVPFGGSRLFSVNTQTNKNDYNPALRRVFKENESCESVGMQTQEEEEEEKEEGLSLKGGRLDGFVQKAARHGKLLGEQRQAKCSVRVSF